MRHITLFILLLFGFSCNSIAQTNPPQGAQIQSFCDSATVADLVATPDPGGTVTWYNAETGGVILNSTVNLNQGQTVWASQTVGGIESALRLRVIVHFINPLILPLNPVICPGESLELSAIIDSPLLSNTIDLGVFDGKHHYVYTQYRSYLTAEFFANSFGGHLSTIRSQEENDFIWNQLNPTLYYWIGLNDIDLEGDFIWNDGAPLSYTNWSPGNPDNAGGNEDGVWLWNGGLWNDAPISNPRSSIFSFDEPITSYLWSTGETTSTIEVNPIVDTSYTVVVEYNGVSCTATINVQAHPIVDAPISGGDQSACALDPVQTLTASASVGAGETLTWYDAPIGGNVVVDPSLSSVGSVTYYAEASDNITGCVSLTRTAVTLEILETPPAVITNNTGVTELTCTITEISLTASGGDTYSWSDGTSVVGTDALLLVSVPGTYTVTVTGANGCFDTASIEITQDVSLPSPVITNNTSVTELTCSVTEISLTASGGDIYSWSDGTSVVGTDALLLVSVPGTYTVTVTGANGCFDTASIEITQDVSLPSPVITNNTGVTELTCSVTEISLTASGGDTYSWSDGASVVGTDALLLVSVPGTYTVTVTGANGCFDTASIEITQDVSLPDAPISGGDQSACSLDPIQTLTASGTVGAGETLTWYDAPSGGSVVLDPSLSAIGNVTYYAEASNDATGCLSLSRTAVNLEILETPTPVITNNTGVTELTCSVTEISLTASGGNTYSWSDGISVVGTNASLIVSTPGTYTVTVTGANGCFDTAFIEITQDVTLPTPGIINNTGVTELTCTVTEISLTATGGDTYSWSDGTTVVSTVADLTVTAPGTYTVTVTATNGCFDTDFIIITQNVDLPDAPISGGDQSACALDPIQTLTATASVEAGETLAWYDAPSGGNVVLDPSLSAVGSVTYYAETSNDTTSCISPTRTAVTLEIFAVPDSPISGGDQTACELDPIQTITATASVDAGETLTWYDAPTAGNAVVDPSLSAIGSVIYYAEAVNNITGCVSFSRTAVTLEILETPTPVITNNTGVSELTCSVTEISLTASGGDSYSWSDGTTVVSTDALLLISTPGTYTVTVTGVNGCFDTDFIEITQDVTLPTPGITNNTGVTELTCSVTQISLNATGGDSYSWSDGTTVVGTDALLLVSVPGTYSVTVTSANGCFDTDFIEITQNITLPTPVITNNTGVSELTCSVTEISLTASGGDSYSWSDGTTVVGTASLLLVSTPGTYTVTVTSANGCFDTDFIEITQNVDLPAAPISGGDQSDCSLDPIQTLTASASVGGGETLTWYDTPTGGNLVVDPSLSNIGSITYYAEASDDLSGCVSLSRTAVSLEIFAVPDAPISGGDLTACALDPVQTLTALASVGAGETLTWYDAPAAGNAVVDPSLSAIGSVTYYAEASDNLTGCLSLSRTAISLEILETPTGAITNNTGVTELTCSVTEISLTATGGDAYSWSDGTTVVGTDALLLVSTPGTYTVTVTGANGCFDTDFVVITQDVTLPTPGITNNTGVSELTCSVTEISLTASGGTSYSWSDGVSVVGTDALLLVSTPGTYTVTVTGANGCSDTASVVITQDITLPVPGVTNNTGVSELTCSVTEISLTASGGDVYSWSDGVSVVGTDALLLVSTPGTYTVTVTGTNGCSDTASVVITQNVDLPAAPISGGDQTACAVDPIQTLTASASVNAGETLTWYDASSAGNVVVDPSLSSVGSITYYAEASDDVTGCLSLTRTAVTLEIFAGPDAPISGGDQTACSLDPIQTLTASAFVNAGETLAWYDASSAGNVVVDPSLSNVGSVTYYAEASDDVTGCVSLTRTAVTLEILETPTPVITNNTGTTELTCLVTEISLTASGGDSYSWSDGISVVGTDALLLVSTPGTYTVTVTGANGCSDTASVVITQDITLPVPGVTNNTGVSELTCSVTEISLTASGGTSYSWSDGVSVVGTDALLLVSTPGTYTVTVTGTNGCSDTASVVITQNVDLPAAPISGGDQTACAVDPIQTLTASASVNAGETLTWYDASSAGNVVVDPSLSSVGSITYYAEASDDVTGCLSLTRTAVTLEIFAGPDAPISGGDQTACSLDPIQTLTASAFVNAGETLAWYDASSAGNVVVDPSLSNVGSVTYYAEASDDVTGCVSLTRTAVTLEILETPTPVITNNTGTTELTCLVTEISLTASGGDSYSWSDGISVVGTDALLLVSTPGTYTVTVTGANGCSDTASVVITQDITLPVPGVTNNTGVSELTCSVTEISLTASGGDVYSWSDGVSVVGTDALLLVSTPGTYTVTVTGTNGCSDTASVVITQNVDLPAAPISGGDQTACAVDPIQTLTASASVNAGETLTWYDASSAGNVVVDPSLSSVGSITYYAEASDDVTGCLSLTRTAVTLEIFAGPDAPISGGDQTACSLDPIQTLTASAFVNAGETLAWYDASSAGNVVVDPSLSNVGSVTYYAEASDDVTGCVSLTRTAVTLEILETPTPVITNNTGTTELTCLVTEISLTASGGDSYSWSDGISVVGTDALLLVSTPGTYTVTVTGANGCSDTASVVITQDIALPVPGVTNNTGVSELTCSVTEISLTASGGTSYSWSDGVSVVGTDALLLVSTPGTYTVTVTGANGCSDTASILISQDIATPAAPISGGDQTACELDPIQTLTASASVNSGETLTWYDALTGGNLITDPSLSNIGSITYYAETTNDLTGCISETRTPVTLEIIATPQAPTAEAEQTFCNASTIADLIAQGENLLWYSEPQGGAAINPATYLINGNVYYGSQTVNGCESLTRTGVQIFIDAPEPPQGQSQQIFCNQGTLTDIELTGTDIIWYPLAQGGDPLPLDHPLENGATYYAAQQIDGCESVLRLAVNIILQQPEPPIAEPEQTTCDLARIRDLEIEGVNIQWYDSPFGGQSLSEETLLTQNSIYFASQTINGCESQERTAIQVTLFACRIKIYNAISANGNGQNDFLIIENIEFYPINSLEIYSRDGDLVYTQNAYGTNGNIFRGFANVAGVFGPDNALPTGTYMYVFTYLDPFREESNTLKGFLTLNSN